MGVEIMGFETAQAPAESITEKENSFLHEKGNEKLDKESGPNQPINFGSHEEEGDGIGVVDVNVPKDAADEWPAPKQIHSFYFVRYRPFEDPKLRAELDQADRDIQAKNQARFEIVEQLKAKRSEKLVMADQLSKLKNDNSQYKTILDEKRRQIEPLWQELGQLRSTSGGGRYGLCSSEEELNDLIYSLQYRIQHESISLTEEKQILKDIKQLEGTRTKVIENAKKHAELQDSLVQKEAIEDQVKLMGVDLDGVKKEKQELFEKIKGLKGEINGLQVKLQTATNEKDKVFDKIKKLRSRREEKNACFYQSRTTITEAKKLAVEKDVKALEKFSCREVCWRLTFLLLGTAYVAF
uniref:Proton pump-interactor 1-like n=1 Tax=Rhizophora mucronata TaxID=61149 RepID=A0A2P2LX83_RHIMU